MIITDYMKSCANRDVCRRAIQLLVDDDTIRQHRHHSSPLIDYRQFCQLVTNIKKWQHIFAHYSANNSALKAERLRSSLHKVGKTYSISVCVCFNSHYAGITISTDVLGQLIAKYMRADATLRFGDFCACILNLLAAFSEYLDCLNDQNL